MISSDPQETIDGIPLLQLPVHRKPHSQKAGRTSDQVGYRFGQKDAVGSQIQREQQGQRHDDDDLAQDGKKDGPLCLPQSDKGGLTHELQAHEDEPHKVNPECADTQRDCLCVRGKNAQEHTGKQQDDQPHGSRVDDTGQRHKTDGFFHPVRFLCAVVVAEYRLGAAAKTADRERRHLADAVDDGHDSHVDIAAVSLQRGVADNLNQAVGKLLHKSGNAQT